MTDAPATTADPLARLAGLMRENAALIARLEGLRARCADAREYLDRPDAHAPFGRAHLDRCRARLLCCLTRLRANRAESLALIGDAA